MSEKRKDKHSKKPSNPELDKTIAGETGAAPKKPTQKPKDDDTVALPPEPGDKLIETMTPAKRGQKRPPTQQVTPSRLLDEWGDTINPNEPLSANQDDTARIEPPQGDEHDDGVHELETQVGTGAGKRMDEWGETIERMEDAGALPVNLPKADADWATLAPTDEPLIPPTQEIENPPSGSKGKDAWGDTIATEEPMVPPGKRPPSKGNTGNQKTSANTPPVGKKKDDWGDTIPGEEPFVPPTKSGSSLGAGKSTDEWGDTIAPTDEPIVPLDRTNIDLPGAPGSSKVTDDWGDTIRPGELPVPPSSGSIGGGKMTDEWGDTLRPGSLPVPPTSSSISQNKMTDEWGDTMPPGSLPMPPDMSQGSSGQKVVDDWGDTLPPGSLPEPPSESGKTGKGTVSWGAASQKSANLKAPPAPPPMPGKGSQDATQKSVSMEPAKKKPDATMAITGEVAPPVDKSLGTMEYVDPNDSGRTAALPSPAGDDGGTVEYPTKPATVAPSTGKGKSVGTQASGSKSGGLAFSVPTAPKQRKKDAAEGPLIEGFEILGELGRGGMGVVYKARQVGLNRVVALKMILSGGGATQKDLERFRIEGESVAQLDHPNVVKIYDVGEHEGAPYFSLEYIDGGSLSQKISKEPLRAREAAEIMLSLAEGMAAAHKQNIIHRDLKPANVMMTTDGIPKITDFGLAKKLDDDSGMTRAGTVLGTPSYMPPEQAEGKINELGAHSDIYSLGAILYDLVTGRPPFRGETLLDTLFLVKTAEPMSPARLQPRLPIDLETICLKCLEKEPSKRYATAGDLAADLRRFLNGEPILARPTPFLVQVVKYCKRKPWVAGTYALGASFLVAMITGGLAYGVIQDRNAKIQTQLKGEAEVARDDAIKSEKEAKAQRDRATANFVMAQRAVKDFIDDVGDQELANIPAAERVRRRILEKGIAYNEEFIKQKGDDPDVRAQAGLAYLRNADILALLNEPKKSEAAFKEASGILSKLASEFPKQPDYKEALAAVSDNYATLLGNRGRDAEAEKFYNEAKVAKEQLAKEFPESAVYQWQYGKTLFNLGALQRKRGQTAAALKSYEQARDVQEKLVALKPNISAYEIDLAATYRLLGELQQVTGKIKEGEQTYRKAVALFEKVAKASPDVPGYKLEWAKALKDIGKSMRDSQPAEAEKYYRQAIAVDMQLVKDFPRTPQYREELAQVYSNLAVLLQDEGRAADAEAAYKQTSDIQEQMVKDFPDSPDLERSLVKNYVNRMLQETARGNAKTVQALYQTASDHAKKLVSKFPGRPEYQLELARLDQRLAALRLLQGNTAESIKMFGDTVENLKVLAKAQPNFPEYQIELARSAMNTGIAIYTALRAPGLDKAQAPTMVADALKAFQLSAETFEKVAKEWPDTMNSDPMNNQDWGKTYQGMAMVNTAIDKKDEALKAHAKAANVRQQNAERNPNQAVYRMEWAQSHAETAILHAQASRLPEAESSFQSAIRVLEEGILPGNRVPAAYRIELSAQMNNLAILLLKLEGARAKEVEPLQRKIVDNYRALVKDYPKNPQYLSMLGTQLRELAIFLVQRMKMDEGLVLLKEAIDAQAEAAKLDPKNTTYRANQAIMLIDMAKVQAILQNHVEIVKAMAELAKVVPPGQPDILLAAAIQVTQAIPMVEAEASTPAAEKKQLADAYAKQAIGLLREALQLGHKDMAVLENNPAFEPLRKRGDMDKLLAGNQRAKTLTRSLPLKEKLVQEQPKEFDPRLDLGKSLNELTAALLQGSRSAEAAKYADEAVRQLQAGKKLNPESKECKQQLAEALLNQARAATLQRDNGAVSKFIADLVLEGPADSADYAKAAGLLARCAEVTMNERETTALADKAMELLQKAAGMGFKDGAALKQPEFAALQNREDFKKLAEKLGK